MRRLKLLKEKNRKLKQLVADLSLDKHTLQDVLSKNALTPGRRREIVANVQASHGVSERRSCLALGVDRSSVRYMSHRPDPAPLMLRIRDLAATRTRYGYFRIYILLRREGWFVNHKRVYRLYRDDGLSLRLKRPRRNVSAVRRERQPAALAANQMWSMDFVSDALFDGRRLRALTVVDAFIVHDIKGENWHLTAGFRAHHGRVLLFDPTNPKSAAYNPLLEVRRGAWEVRDVQNVADVLVDPEGSLERRNHWEKTSHSLLVGTILHVLYAEPDKTLAGVAAFLSDPKRPIETTLTAMMTTPHLGEAGPHPVVASAARELLNKADNERSGVLSTAMSFLGLYRDPVVADVTRRCDWRIADLVEGVRPSTLYLVVPPSDIARTKPLIRLILNQIGRRLTEDLNGKAGRHRLLLMLDEFPALGRLDFFESALAFMAGYGLKAFLIAQSLNQIEKAYGPNNSILDNCHVRVSFATNDERTAKRVSDALGTATEMRAMKNYAGHRLSPWLGHLMVSRSETARPLLTPGEIMQLPSDDEIVMVAGTPPIRAKKVRYFEEWQLQARVLAPPVLAQNIAIETTAGDDWSSLPLTTKTQADHDPIVPGEPVADGGGPARRLIPEIDSVASHAPEPPSANEFDLDSPTRKTDDRVRLRTLNRNMQHVARQASLDPQDGIEL